MKDKKSVDILFVSHRYELTGGAEKALIEMLIYLAAKKINTHTIVGSTGSFIDSLKKNNLEYSIIEQPLWAHGPEDPSPFVFNGSQPELNPLFQTVKLIMKLKPKLCVTNTSVVPWLAYASSITNTPHAWMIHEMGTAGLKLNYAIGETQTIRTIDTFSDAIFFNSKITADYYSTALKYNSKIRIVYPGGNTPKPQIISNPFKNSVFKLIIIGQIKPQKGQMDAIKAVKMLVDKGHRVQLLIIGGVEDDNYHKNIIEYIKNNGLEDNISLIGHVDNPASFLVHTDVALVCSVNEAFGKVTVEAMLLGKPVIGANSAGTSEIIQSDDIGLLYEPGNPKALSKAILYLMSNPYSMKNIGIKAKLEARKVYADEPRYSEFLHYYKHEIKYKKSLDATPIFSTLSDFNSVVHQRDSYLIERDLVLNSRSWRYSRFISKYIPINMLSRLRSRSVK